MQKKSKILIISHKNSFPKHETIVKLRKKYDLFFYNLNRKKSVDEQVQEIEKTFSERFDGIVSFNDQTSILASVLTDKYKLIGPRPSAVAAIQNKSIFNRLDKSKALLPESTVINIKQNIYKPKTFPAFIKPAKGSLSEGAIKIGSSQEYRSFFNNPIKPKQYTLDHSFFSKYSQKDYDSFYVLQPYIDADQFTVDGYIRDGRVTLFAFTKSIYDADRKSFIQFDYPISFSKLIEEKLHKAIEYICHNTGLDNSFFNVEFFLNQSDIHIIEMNTRPAFVFESFYNLTFSQSLIEMTIQLALGKEPIIKLRLDHLYCKSFILRKYNDHVVESIPNEDSIEKLKSKYKLTQLKLLCNPGKRLSEYKQDAYSYRYAIIDLCGKTEADIVQRVNLVKNELKDTVTFSPVSD